MEKDILVFLHTNTREGEFCADSLLRYYQHKGFLCQKVKIAGMEKYMDRFDSNDLMSVIISIMSQIREARLNSQKPLLIATGGFKIETSLTAIIGMLEGVPVYYIYETMKDVVKIPPLPVTWDQKNLDLISRGMKSLMDDNLSIGQKESVYQSHPLLQEMVIFRDGKFIPSSVAVAMLDIWERHQTPILWPPDSGILPQNKNHIAHLARFQDDKDLLDKVQELCRIAFVKAVRPASEEWQESTLTHKAESGEILYRIKGVPLVLETTATSEEQCRMILDYLGNH